MSDVGTTNSLAPGWAATALTRTGWVNDIPGHPDLWRRGEDVGDWTYAIGRSVQRVVVKPKPWWEQRRFVVGVLTALVVTGLLGPQLMDVLNADSPIALLKGLVAIITVGGGLWFTARQKVTAMLNDAPPQKQGESP